MEIKLNEEELQKATSLAIQGGISSALGSYEMKQLIQNQASGAILESAILQAVKGGVEGVDLDSLSKEVASEFTKTFLKAINLLISESMVELILKMRGLNDYSTGYKEAKESLFEVFAGE